MGGTGIIDQFLETFSRYIDSGFGLLGGEVGYLASTLAAIDVTLAGLFWSWVADEDILARLVKKTLFVGVFAFLIGNWNSLARAIFESFAGLGLKASGTGLSSAAFLRPGKIAQVGLDAAITVHGGLWWQSAAHRQRHGARAWSTLPSRSRHLRAWHRQRHRIGWTATWCGSCRRHGLGRWWRHCGWRGSRSRWRRTRRRRTRRRCPWCGSDSKRSPKPF